MIYLDNAATTRPDGDALSRAEAFVRTEFYNPSALYGGGLKVAAEVKEARGKLLSFIADPERFELVFTSGGTEADNLAVFSSARRGNAVTTAGEHAAVYRCFTELKNRGIEPRFAPLNRDGSVDPEKVSALVDGQTSLVSVVHVNNETGAVNDIAEIARRVKEKNPRCRFHSDGVQAFGKIPVRLGKEIDLYSVSAHKIGGLKGTGALIKGKGLALSPQIFGGGQEGTLRSGTENVLGILDFRFAAEKKFSSLAADGERLLRLRDALWAQLDSSLFSRISPAEGSPYILTVTARGMRGEVLQRMIEARGTIVGTGSACSSKKPHSRVLEACGYDGAALDGVLRLSFSPETDGEEIAAAAEALNGSAREYRERL